ncbi:hypothetical protein BJ508DRAFT_375933, partial [Ascobolus immersus RN42]
MASSNTTTGIFSLPFELHERISHFATLSSLIALAKTCRNADRIYRTLHLEKMVYLTRISTAYAGLSPVDHDPEETELSKAINGTFHERVVQNLANKAPVAVVVQFFDRLGWDVKRTATFTHIDGVADLVGVDEVYNPGPLPPYLALLPLQVIFRLIQEIPEKNWNALSFFVQQFSDLCKPTPGSPHPSGSPKANYALPEFRYLNTLDLSRPSPIRDIALLIILAKNIGPNLNTFAMPYYLPWFYVKYPQLAEFLM